ncbi:hypothetical protein, variant [Sphaeroforma arctica JP610]|uniref:Uncharacterized protein n=1 Tax=Sphaeroforma arctica JP610 TaxID=667725 RepID=A0A0L0FJW6_9EUKA|nr:hypothetical protein, variant [Sphaeroforma arctica JP610]KNC76333.1 hypothetical protein, variant [Sphaeroforma arctica JP610]|eukprot:XP_014150235.1 hypothetical protein, variant [Sphaeroforma arctica JP610]
MLYDVACRAEVACKADQDAALDAVKRGAQNDYQGITKSMLPNEIGRYLLKLIVYETPNDGYLEYPHCTVGTAFRNANPLYIHCYKTKRKDVLLERWQLKFTCHDFVDEFQRKDLAKAIEYITEVRHRRNGSEYITINIQSDDESGLPEPACNYVEVYRQLKPPSKLPLERGEMAVCIICSVKVGTNSLPNLPNLPSHWADTRIERRVKSEQYAQYDRTRLCSSIKPIVGTVGNSFVRKFDSITKAEPIPDILPANISHARFTVRRDQLQSRFSGQCRKCIATSPLRFSRSHLQAEQRLAYCTWKSPPLVVASSSSRTPRPRALSMSAGAVRHDNGEGSPSLLRASTGFIGRIEHNLLTAKMSMMCAEPLMQFSVRLGVYSPTRSYSSVTLDANVTHFENSEDCWTARNSVLPYCAVVKREGNFADSRRPGWYRLPKSGSLNIAIINPNGTPIKVLVLKYDVSDMPPSCKTMIRQRYSTRVSDIGPRHPPRLRHAAHVVLATSSKNIVYLTGNLTLAFMHCVEDSDLDVTYESPQNPRYFPM